MGGPREVELYKRRKEAAGAGAAMAEGDLCMNLDQSRCPNGRLNVGN